MGRGQSKVSLTHDWAWQAKGKGVEGKGSKAKKTHNTGLEEQSQMRWWENGDITCSGMHHESSGKMHWMSVFGI